MTHKTVEEVLQSCSIHELHQMFDDNSKLPSCQYTGTLQIIDTRVRYIEHGGCTGIPYQIIADYIREEIKQRAFPQSKTIWDRIKSKIK